MLSHFFKYLFLLLISERVTGEHLSTRSINWHNTSYIITRLEAFDQTNGSGGELYQISGGDGFRFVDLYFNARFVGSSIDFIVKIFGELEVSRDVILGEITETNILVERYSI